MAMVPVGLAVDYFGRGAYVRLRKEYLPESRAGGRP